MRFRFIHAERASYPLWLLCKTLRVDRQGYYSWLRRGERQEQDFTDLDQAIKEIHKEHRRYYGTRRQQRELRKRGFYVSRRLIRERMKFLGLKVKYIKAFRVTTETDSSANFAPNLLDRNFSPEQANQAWCGDISYVKRPAAFSIWRS